MPLHPPRATRWLLGIAGGLLVIAVAGVAAFIATFDVNRLIAPGQGRVKALTGRDLLIRGGATLEISLHPRLVASDVSISNWPGAGSAPLATDAEGRGNWEFDTVAALGGACLFG